MKSCRWSIPSRRSTTIPSALRSSPHTFSTSSASWVPSTRIRLALATLARAGPASIEPDRVRLRAPPAGILAEERFGITKVTVSPPSANAARCIANRRSKPVLVERTTTAA